MKKKKLLIIDDEANLARMLKLNLDETNAYETYILNDGLQAIHRISELMPDLVLLDIMMPGIQGVDIAGQMAIDDSLKNIGVIFLSATQPEKLDNINNTLNGHKYIPKPVKIDTLLTAIRQELEQT